MLNIIQGKTTIAEASRTYGLSPSEIEGRIKAGKRGMDNALRAKPRDVREQYDHRLKDLQKDYSEAMLELRATKRSFSVSQKIAVPVDELVQYFATIGESHALLSVASTPHKRWSTDLCRIRSGRDDWATLVLMIDCHTRELLG